MKKTLLTMVAIMATGAAMAQNGITEIPDTLGYGLQATTMSPNGKYVAGSLYATGGGYMYDRETQKMWIIDLDDEDTDLQFKAIANNGLAVGWDGPASTFNFDTQEINQYGETDEYLFQGINPAGTIIVGARYEDGSYDGIPCYFNNGTPVDLPQPSAKFLGYEASGASALSVSDDSLISGYFIDDFSTYPATLWALNKDGQTFSCYPFSRRYFAPTMESTMPYSMFSTSQTTMSPNGKWLIVNFEQYVSDWDAVRGVARYNTENDSVDFFVADTEDERFADGGEIYGFSVSDEGTIVGFYGAEYGPRVGFQWKKGEADIQTLSSAYPGATRLADYDDGGFNTPDYISADGRYIMGFAFATPASSGAEESEDSDDDSSASAGTYISWILDTQDEAAQTSGVEEVKAGHSAKKVSVKARYAVDGTQRQGKFKGVNILRLSNGKAVKTIVK